MDQLSGGGSRCDQATPNFPLPADSRTQGSRRHANGACRNEAASNLHRVPNLRHANAVECVASDPKHQLGCALVKRFRHAPADTERLHAARIVGHGHDHRASSANNRLPRPPRETRRTALTCGKCAAGPVQDGGGKRTGCSSGTVLDSCDARPMHPREASGRWATIPAWNSLSAGEDSTVSFQMRRVSWLAT